MDSDLQLQNHQYSDDSQQHHHQQQPLGSGLMRYRSAPSSYVASLINTSVGGVGENCDGFLNPRPSSPETTERIFVRFVSSGGGTEDASSHNLCNIGQNSSPNEAVQSQLVASMKQENDIFHRADQQQNKDYSSAASQMICQNNQSQSSLPNQNYRVVSSMPMDQMPQMKMGVGSSNLIRHSSSPAGLFSHINIENGYGVMRGMGNIGAGNSTNAEAAFPSPSRLKVQMDFSSGPSSSSGLMIPVSETESKSSEVGSFGKGNRNDSGYITGFPVGSWDDSAIISESFLQRLEDDERKTFSGMNASENQNAEGGNRPPIVLSHHLSLPTSSAELSTMEKLLHFQDSVPCKIRAKRGCATHPRSIAERVRRTRISERMRKLQELVPNMDKQTNTADMLDLAVDYIKDLQKQLKTLSDNRAKCTCSNKQRP